MKKRKLLSLIQSVVLMFACFPAQNARAEEESADVDVWDGTVDTSWYDDEETEFHLYTAEQFAGAVELGNTRGYYFNEIIFYLESDLDFSNIPFESFSYFNGVFEGNNHQIYNLQVKDSLFGVLLENGVVQNCYVCGSVFHNISESCKLGSICYCNYGLINNVSFCGRVQSASPDLAEVGGICALNYQPGIITNCSVCTDISGIMAGGICGHNAGEITNCSVSGTISIIPIIYSSDPQKTKYGFGGGICGYTQSGKIENCYNLADITFKIAKNKTGMHEIGGIIGAGSRTQIKNVYSVGCFEGESTKVGGIIGYAGIELIIENAYYLSGIALKGIETIEESASIKDTTLSKKADNLKSKELATVLGESFIWIDNDYPKLKNCLNLGYGNLNSDYYINADDVIILQKVLLTEETINATEAYLADLDYNGIINSCDLTLLKRMLIKQ